MPLATISFIFSIKLSISFGVTIKLYSSGARISFIIWYLSSSWSVFKKSFDSPFSCAFFINRVKLSAAMVAASTTVGISSCNCDVGVSFCNSLL